MLQSNDRPVLARAVAVGVLVLLILIGCILWEGSLFWLQEGWNGDSLVATGDLQTLIGMADHTIAGNGGELLVLPVGTKCWIAETRPCAGCKSLYASRVLILERYQMGKLLWVCSDNVRPVYLVTL